MLKLKIFETFGLSRLETISDVPANVNGLCCKLEPLISQFDKLRPVHGTNKIIYFGSK